MAAVATVTPTVTGFQLKVSRLQAKVHQDEIAARMGVHRSRVSHIEMDDAPTPAAIRRYVEALEAARAERS